MSSDTKENNVVKVEYKEDEVLDLNPIVIPFSLFFPKKQHDIYDGSEKISFNKRDPLYKAILLQEFDLKKNSEK
ncbi:MAG: hypothetical protein ACFFD7_11940 [Candidatus Thorarchaeota archaeon]